MLQQVVEEALVMVEVEVPLEDVEVLLEDALEVAAVEGVF